MPTERTQKMRLLKLASVSSFMAIAIALTLASTSLAMSPIQEYLDAHNVARSEVGVGPLTWNNTVAAYAMNYAETKMGDCQMEHSEGPYGENLAEGYDKIDPGDAVRFWLTEKVNYDHTSNSCVGGECGHYTQVVWRDSLQLGCASLKCQNNWVFLICNYYPPGNIIGQRPY